MNHIKPELVVAAGDWASLQAALDAGADAVYFGLKKYNLRINARNFELNELPKIVARCREHGARAYVTLNTIMFDEEVGDVGRARSARLPQPYGGQAERIADRNTEDRDCFVAGAPRNDNSESLRASQRRSNLDSPRTNTPLSKIITSCKESGIDAIICWDFAVIEAARAVGIPVHVSTQASVSNFRAVQFYYNVGVKRIVLARECTLAMIKHITDELRMRKMDLVIEVFAHGAMCISVSGRCFMSEYLYGRSANRGDCLQPCRRRYHLVDAEDVGVGAGFPSASLGTLSISKGKPASTVMVEDGYVLSPKDLCTVDILDQLLETGVGALKIEGRTRPPDYIKTVTEVYRAAIDECFVTVSRRPYPVSRGKNGIRDTEYGIRNTRYEIRNTRYEIRNTTGKSDKYLQKLRTVYNRGFSHGFYLGRPQHDLAEGNGSAAVETKQYLGEVVKFYQKIEVAEVRVRNGAVSVGDQLLFTGRTTGTHQLGVREMQNNHQPVMTAPKGTSVAIKTGFRVRRKDKVFLLT